MNCHCHFDTSYATIDKRLYSTSQIHCVRDTYDCYDFLLQYSL